VFYTRAKDVIDKKDLGIVAVYVKYLERAIQFFLVAFKISIYLYATLPLK
jgi:hypothetical protein